MRTRILFSVVPFVLLLAFTGATPLTQSKEQSSEAKIDRETQRGRLGVSIQDVNRKFAKSKDLSVEYGAYVAEVQRNSPADSAGILEGDVITEFDGKPIDESYDLQRAVARTEPGTKVKVKVVRKNETKTVEVKIGSQRSQRQRLTIVTPPKMPRFEIFRESQLSGLQLMELNEQLAKYFEVPDRKGVLVREVEKGSTAEKAGFKAGDVIVKFGSKRVEEVRDVRRALRAYDEGEKADVEIIRKGSKRTLSLELTKEMSENWFDFEIEGLRGKNFPHGYHFRVSPHQNWDELQFDLDRIRPELGEIEIDMERLRDRLKEIGPEIRERIEREIPRIQIRSNVVRSI